MYAVRVDACGFLPHEAHRLSHSCSHTGGQDVRDRPPWIYTACGDCRTLPETAMHADPAIRRTDAPVPRDDLIRRWQVLAADPETPDHFELDQFGELILSPKPTTGHQTIAAEVALQTNLQLGRLAVGEVSVLTDRGIRVPDVVWMPAERWAACRTQSPLEVVPDVCVEVLSPSNTRQEIEMKIGAYLRGGAREVIVVGLKGEIEIFGSRGKRETSALGIALALPPELF
jgi:Uma2 family endonuclease